ncbi:hypothetical protein CWI38_0133p0020 [Hamiltosporidium tvaerminnensis]|uniref:Tc1-like transposase DDE domain-containing protein n=1 Tax=Hamiltosporidium tvaerminnensis TaxID=1176355 RepID=A0A4Q9M1T0_9MICR|nr:hypothetical protein CWI38_0133p0020 [Hamiltosporidium tvaerminnensis]
MLIVSLDDISDRRSKLTLEIKESLQTYVDLECTKTLYELAELAKCTLNVNVSTSTIDRAPETPERRNKLSTIDLRTNYATCFRELEVDNDDKNFVFLDESAYLSVTEARSRNISVVAVMNKYGMIYHKIHERAVNDEDLELSIKEINESYNARIHHYRGLNDDEEIASYRIKYLPPYSPFLNPIENPQLRILICEKFNEIGRTLHDFKLLNLKYYLKFYFLKIIIILSARIMILIETIMILIENYYIDCKDYDIDQKIIIWIARIMILIEKLLY